VTSADHQQTEQAHAVYRQLAHDLPTDLRLGLNLGFYRTFAVPSIARALAGTGKMTRQPRARAKATGALIFTLVEHGLSSPAADESIEVLKRLHVGLPVSENEYVYVLAAFCIAPMRWIDRYGPRRTTDEEKNAAHAFYAGIADRMGIGGVPGSYQALAGWMDEYEHTHFAVTPESQALMNATRSLVADRFPALLAPLARAGTDALLDEPLRSATATPCPPAIVQALVTAALRARACAVHAWSPRSKR
jgi:hypothetical protein